MKVSGLGVLESSKFVLTQISFTFKDGEVFVFISSKSLVVNDSI